MKRKSVDSENSETEPIEVDEVQDDASLSPVEQLHKIADKIRAEEKDRSVVVMYGDKDILQPTEFISTGSILLDNALGGGVPRGRIIELYGLEGGGKTSAVLSTMVHAQKKGLFCHFIDAEMALNAEWATSLGVDMNFLLISQLNCTQDVFNLVETSIDNGVQFIVIDSLAALSPREELEGEVGDYHVGLQARLVGQALRKLAVKVGKANVALVIINQIRLQVGIMFGNPETTPGGKALKFYSSIRLDVRTKSHLGGKEAPTGVSMRAYVAKNKVAPPFRTAEVDFYFNRGFDNEASYFTVALDAGVIVKKGAYYTFPAYDDVNRYERDWVELFRTDPGVLKLLIDEVKKCGTAQATES